MCLYTFSDNGIVVVLKFNLASPLTSVLVKYTTQCKKFREFSSSWQPAEYNKYVYNINIQYRLSFVTPILSSCKISNITCPA